MKKTLQYATVLLVISGVAGGGLHFVNELTRDRIAAAQRKNLADGQKLLLPAAARFSAEKTFPLNGRASVFYEAYDAAGTVIGYELDYAVQGYQSQVRVLSAVGPDGVVRGIKVLSQAETPGLGAEIETVPATKSLWQALAGLFRPAAPATAAAPLPPFQTQFANKRVADLVVVKSKTADNIEAISGATITSAAVTKAVREPVEAFLAWHAQQGK
jgi:electron transport complex protein RnfG